MDALSESLAHELGLRPAQVARTLALQGEGATVPFIARYRKEATGGLDEVQIQTILDRAQQWKELAERKAAVRKSIEEQGKLDPALARAIEGAASRAELEDLYLPFRPKRRTRAMIARERGLKPLAQRIWEQAPGSPRDWAARFVKPERDVADVEAALSGARDICAERMAEDAGLRSAARERLARTAALTAKVDPKRKGERTKFESYYDFSQELSRIPSHRVLAMLRGEAEDILQVRLSYPVEVIDRCLDERVIGRRSGPASEELRKALREGWSRLMKPSLENELRAKVKEGADREAIEVFAENLRHLLLAPPAGARRILALDPGLRTGTKAAMIDATGRVLATETLYTEIGAAKREAASRILQDLVQRHAPELIAVGNGTGSREAEAFVRETLGKVVPIVSVSEQGASVYSASEVAREEFPDLDVSLRGAISIGRRLQDPLAELVKVEPRSIGVGQYQHDVDQGLLQKKLREVVDVCVNQVGVDVNTASARLLEHVSGIGPVLAKRIVEYRDEQGPFPGRAALRKVKGFGPKAFEQAAGFLRIRGSNPLDDSAVHPERYPVVEQMARDLGVGVRELVGSPEKVRRIDWRRYAGEDLGEPTLRDILSELEKPGRDPRGDFSAPSFREDVQRLEDLKEGMVLEGVVTNVTDFGAFVDVGVHQDGLVHVSQLSARFVKHPSDVVRVGERLRVRVISVDLERKRLGLSAKEV